MEIPHCIIIACNNKRLISSIVKLINFIPHLFTTLLSTVFSLYTTTLHIRGLWYIVTSVFLCEFYAYLAVIFLTNREFKKSYDKTAFWFRTTKEFVVPDFFFFFRIIINWTWYLELYWREQVTTKWCDNFLANVIFKTSYFLNEIILQKSKENRAR